MSNTSLWEIDRNWSGREYSEYRNSWLFCPTVWDVLMCKYITPEERTERNITQKNYLCWVAPFDKDEANRRHNILNDRINNSEIQYDRVLWELSNLSVFNTKDKEFVADCIEKFVENNLLKNPEYFESKHIYDRFLEIANDIRNLPRRVKYFVIHPTSCDDNVEWWFYNKRLSSWDKFVCEFTLIEDDNVVGFATNLDICKRK